MPLVDELREAAKIARERDGLRGTPAGLDKAADRIEALEASLRELLDAFNPTPRVSTRLTIWGRAAMALDGTPDQDR